MADGGACLVRAPNRSAAHRIRVTHCGPKHEPVSLSCHGVKSGANRCYHARMALRKIAHMGEPILRQVAAAVPAEHIATTGVQELIGDMLETMRDADGAGIAAPQVYEPWRICVIEVQANPRYPHFPEIPLYVLINPVVEPLVGRGPDGLRPEESVTMYEGCLSVPGLRGRVQRPRRVRVRALDRRGAPLDFTWEGVRAAVIQHELDHLDGILFVDRAAPGSLTFQREYERYVPAEGRFVDGGV